MRAKLRRRGDEEGEAEERKGRRRIPFPRGKAATRRLPEAPKSARKRPRAPGSARELGGLGPQETTILDLSGLHEFWGTPLRAKGTVADLLCIQKF